MNIPNEIIATTISKHPELFQVIEQEWGRAEMDTTLENIITTKAKKISKVVRQELVNLYIIHKDHYTFMSSCKQ